MKKIACCGRSRLCGRFLHTGLLNFVEIVQLHPGITEFRRGTSVPSYESSDAFPATHGDSRPSKRDGSNESKRYLGVRYDALSAKSSASFICW